MLNNFITYIIQLFNKNHISINKKCKQCKLWRSSIYFTWCCTNENDRSKIQDSLINSGESKACYKFKPEDPNLINTIPFPLYNKNEKTNM